jgi:uncharacterized protein
MKVLMTGASGLVGAALTNSLLADGHTVCRLVRRETVAAKTKAKSRNAGADARLIDVPWDPEACGGSSLRVKTTRGLVIALGRLKTPPRVLVSASAIGYYGNRGDQVLTEDTKPGTDFLAQVAQEWEAEAKKAEALGMRVVLTRFGIILARHGGALPQMMRPFKFFVGGKIGDGQQWMSWIALDDVVRIVRHVLETTTISGALNAVAPQPVDNAEFTQELARAMHRPAFFPVPSFALRLALGDEMANALLLTSQRVEPARLRQSHYGFLHENLRDALGGVLQAK